MAVYLVDYENVNISGFDGINKLTRKDSVIVFYSDKANTLTVSLHNNLMKVLAKVSFVKIFGSGSNCLDFQLSTYLGYLISKNQKESYYIVSKDKGFEYVISFWKDKNVNVIPVINVAMTPENAVKTVKKPVSHQGQSVKSQLSRLIPQYSSEIHTVAEYIEKSRTRCELNNLLLKKYGSEKTGVIFKAIKPLLVGKKGS